MRKLSLVAALAALSLPFFAGQECASQEAACASQEARCVWAELATFRCANECPLAAKANFLRSYGSEAPAAGTAVLAAAAREVEANLQRI